MYSTVPITSIHDSIVFVNTMMFFMVCSICFLAAHLLTRNKISNYMLICVWVCFVIMIVTISIDIYQTNKAKTILVPQHKVTAKLINVATDNVNMGKNDINTISVAVYEVENGDIVTFPVKFGDPIVKNAILYVKDKQ